MGETSINSSDMIYLKAGLIAVLITFSFNANSINWQKAGERHGNAIYYSDDGKGYYRKVSESEIAKKEEPQVYIVIDESGYFYHHIDENGGGGSYSYTVPEGAEELYDDNQNVQNIIYHPDHKAVSYDYRCPCEGNRSDAEISKSEVNVSALYPVYFDNH
ncbi:MAG: hypothetical protein COV35_11040 [Alphaproteobacteria bacterium CG11_big_fil_rev_8_21_14_0_20_39_49]|nr:MAG: hypothetical protein COV35_11040 [Alphaproteobacteria bacterium CG11_big_fil_rev_8_21_14_0_20_39_49]